MRLWSIHPKYLDSKGLVVLWRESLLAQAVLSNKTKGYLNHSQLIRFKNCEDSLAAISYYLDQVSEEANYNRHYSFDVSKISKQDDDAPVIKVTLGQVEYEFKHLKNKLLVRCPELISQLPESITQEHIHPLFELIDGGIEKWEIL